MAARTRRAKWRIATSAGSAAPPARQSGASYVVMAPLLVLLAGYGVYPTGQVHDYGYPLIGTLCIGLAFWGLLRNGPPRPTGWLLVLGGFLGWVVGDWWWMVEQTVFGVTAYPAPSDGVYIASYGVMAAGLVIIVRRRGSRGDLPALLDAAILAAGTAVVVGVFVIAPIAHDSTLTLAGKLTGSAYPVGDILLLGILARLWTTPGARTTAFKLLAACMAVTLFADGFYNYASLHSSTGESLPINDVLWLASYVLLVGAAWSPSVHDLADPLPGREDLVDPRKRMVVLTLGLVLPALTLLFDDLGGGGVSGVLIAVGSVVLSILVLSRMAGLISIVSAQAVQLAALARSDSLTGVPNRRTLDYELSRACQAARANGAPLTVAIMDLDRFKVYNDTYGHPAGDLLLREATAAWVDLLDDDEVLARYGGEEFVVLFPGQSAAQARRRVLALLAVTPSGQTFSAGIATWNPETDPSEVLSGADIAMYTAKSQGRNRVCLAIEDDLEVSQVHQVQPDIVLQPIVELDTRTPIAVEALSRFPSEEAAIMFAAARLDGTWVELEAAAIAAALDVDRLGLMLAVNVSLDGLTMDPVREALSGDLTDVILEITEGSNIEPTPTLNDEIQSLRARGAIIAIDDWGKGFSNLDRVLLLRPEIVKIDLSLVHNLDLDYHRAAIEMVCAWANQVGALICAEGVETELQSRQLQALGVHLGQGWLYGAPDAPLGVAHGSARIAGAVV